MRIPKLTVAALAVSAIAAGGAVALTSASGASSAGTLTFTARPSSGTPVDLGPKGTSIGDQFLESGTLRSGAGGRKGHFELTSQLVSGNERHGTEASSIMLHLKRGEIVATGGHGLSERYVLPVVGGSGRYAGAGGTFRISPGKGESTRLAIVLTR